MPDSPEQYERLLRLVERLDGTLNPDGTLNNTGPAHDVLAALVKYDTSSSDDPKICKSNVELVKALEHCFRALGLETEYYDGDIYPPGSGIKQATLVARLCCEENKKPAGQADYNKVKGGVVFAGGTDVAAVPQSEYLKWNPTHNPFEMGDVQDRMIGRGISDMRDTIYNMLATAELYKNKKNLLDKPVYLALAWGEDIGARGSESLIRLLGKMKADPEVVIFGAPTNGNLIVGHKGAINMDIAISSGTHPLPIKKVNTGMEIKINSTGGISSSEHAFINANYYGNMLIERLKEVQKKYGTDDLDLSLVNMDTGSESNYVPSIVCIDMRIGTNDETMHKSILKEIRGITEEVQDQLKNDTEALMKKTGNKDLNRNRANVSVITTGKFSSAPDASLAITRAEKIYQGLAELQEKYKKEYASVNNGFSPPYPIINVGIIKTGSYPGNINLGVHIRPTTLEEGPKIMDEINAITSAVQAELKESTGRASIKINKLYETTPLPNQATGQRQRIIDRLAAGVEKSGKPRPGTRLVSYTTEAGGISAGLAKLNGQRPEDSPATVLYGLGNLERTHQPNEYITTKELSQGTQFPLMAIWEFCVGADKKLNNTPSSTIIPTTPAKMIEQAQRYAR